MSFFERYAATCTEHGIEPCSQRAADLFGISRSTISSWNTKNTFPKGETVAAIADALGVSADYLLGRTDNPIDYANSAPVVEDVSRDYMGAIPDFVSKFRMLDDVDKAKAEAYLDGLLSADKYRTEIQAKNA
jgi:transcriptional regulator with XRE-family HTH domain